MRVRSGCGLFWGGTISHLVWCGACLLTGWLACTGAVQAALEHWRAASSQLPPATGVLPYSQTAQVPPSWEMGPS